MAATDNNGNQTGDGKVAKQTGDGDVAAQANERMRADAIPPVPTDANPLVVAPNAEGRIAGAGAAAAADDRIVGGALAMGADGFGIVNGEGERQRFGIDRAREALNTDRPIIRIVGPEQAQQMVAAIRERNGSILLSKEIYEVKKIPITSNSLVSTSENYVNTTADVKVTTPDGEKITIGAKTEIPAGTIFEEDGRIRAAHPDDAGITINGRLIPNGSTIADRTGLSGGQNAAPGEFSPTRKVTDLTGNRVVDGYPLTATQFGEKYEGFGDGQFRNIANPNPIEHVEVPKGVTIEYVRLLSDGQPERSPNGELKVTVIHEAGSMFRGDGYSVAPHILFSTWFKAVDVANADKLLAMYEQRGLGNSDEARALKTNRDALANAEARSNLKVSGGLSNAQIEQWAEHSHIVTDPEEAVKKAVARVAKDAKTPQEREAAIRALNEGTAAQRKFMNGLKSTSGAVGSVFAIGGALVASSLDAKAQEKEKEKEKEKAKTFTFGPQQAPVR